MISRVQPMGEVHTKAYRALRVHYNEALRMILGLPRYCSASGMFDEVRMDTMLRRRVASMKHRMRGRTAFSGRESSKSTCP